MSRTSRTILMITLCSGLLTVAAGDEGNWPSFRGPGARGIAEGHATPTTWDVATGKNILWKTPIPGLGHSAPVIWGDWVFVTTSISGKADPELKVGLYGNVDSVEDDTVHKWKVLALDKRSGKILWERTAFQGVPKVKRHTKASHANASPATDGKHVVANFGSEGLYCYRAKDGKLVWKKDLGVLDSGWYVAPDAQWGYGSSPVIWDGKVFVQADVQKDSFIAAFDVQSGKQLWRTPRDEVPTWSTPTIHDDGERAQLIVNGYKHIGGYDPRTGKELWKMKGGGDIPIPTPYVADGLIYITNAHGNMAPIYAIRTSAQGDISLEDEATANEHIAWSKRRTGSYMPTSLVYGDHLYVCRDSGVVTAWTAKTGEKAGQRRLGTGRTGFTASGVAADGKLYFTSEIGEIYVIKAGPELEELAVNSMDEITMATPAISEGVLYFRTRGHLVAVGEKPAGK